MTTAMNITMSTALCNTEKSSSDAAVKGKQHAPHRCLHLPCLAAGSGGRQVSTLTPREAAGSA